MLLHIKGNYEKNNVALVRTPEVYLTENFIREQIASLFSAI
jgi:hypothetical protein